VPVSGDRPAALDDRDAPGCPPGLVSSWLVASATMLGQNSQAVLETLAKAADKRLRETCVQVLASMGDVLKQRMMGLSTSFNADESDFPSPKL